VSEEGGSARPPSPPSGEIFASGSRVVVRAHTLNPHARIRDDGLVVYPAGQVELF